MKPLLSAKLSPPPPPAGALARGPIAARLAAARAGLILLVAPAGFGKTTLLASGLAAQPAGGRTGPGAAWLSLDERDNDPTRFWGHLIAALERRAPGVGDHARAMLQSPQPAPIEVIVGALVDDLAALPAAPLLILDDYQAIQSAAIHAGVAALIDQLPPGMRLAIASRSDPPLPLARLRLRGDLLELRAADLRFSRAEADGFFAAQGLALSADDLAELSARTEGWPGALQLAALSLRDSDQPGRLIAAFAGSNRQLVDYLAEEVLSRQPAELQRALLETSVLDPLCAELCDALRAEEAAELPSARVLEQIERAGLFLSPLDADRRWYRYHSLFAGFLRERLRRDQPAREPLLHRRAADWYAAAGLPVEAVGHLLAAGDHARAAALIEQQGRPLLLRSEVATVLGWLRALPAELAQARPGLGLIEAWACAVAGQFAAAEAPLSRVDRLLAGLPEPGDSQISPLTAPYTPRNLRSEALAVRATIAGLRRDAPRAVELARAALAELPDDSVIVRGVVALMLGTSAYISGDMAAAASALEQAASGAQAARLPIIAIFALRQLGELHGRVGQLHRAARSFQAAIDLGAQLYPNRGPQPARPVPVAGAAYVGMGLLQYEWGDLAAAEALLADGLHLGRQGANVEILLMGPIGMARLQRARGAAPAARATMAAALAFARATGVPRLAHWIGAEQARLALGLGDLAAAAAWDQERALPIDGPLSYLEEIDYLALAQLRLAQGRPAAAARLLARLRALAEAEGRHGSLVEICALAALAHAATGELTAARESLLRALALALPEGYLRSFVDLGEPMRAQLAAYRMQLAAQARRDGPIVEMIGALDRMLAAFPAAPPAPQLGSPAAALIEPLTAREIEVLALVAAGLSNQDIAAQLIVGLSTVKKHINNAYGKLAVASRTQALKKARELGIIP